MRHVATVSNHIQNKKMDALLVRLLSTYWAVGKAVAPGCTRQVSGLTENPKTISGERISCFINGVFTNVLCVSRFFSEKVYSEERRKIGIKTRCQFPKGTWHQIKIRARKGPTQGIIQKCEPHECSPCASRFEERSQGETLKQERCARREAWNLAKIFTLKKMRTKLYSHH